MVNFLQKEERLWNCLLFLNFSFFLESFGMSIIFIAIWITNTEISPIVIILGIYIIVYFFISILGLHYIRNKHKRVTTFMIMIIFCQILLISFATGIIFFPESLSEFLSSIMHDPPFFIHRLIKLIRETSLTCYIFYGMNLGFYLFWLLFACIYRSFIFKIEKINKSVEKQENLLPLVAISNSNSNSNFQIIEDINAYSQYYDIRAENIPPPSNQQIPDGDQRYNKPSNA